MATNKIEKKFDGLMSQSARCRIGADEIGAGIPLLINTGQVIGENRAELASTQAAYKQYIAALEQAFENYHEGFTECRTWCMQTRDYLKRYLGNEFNQAWTAAGFHNSLAIEPNEAFVNTLLGSLAAFFDDHEDWQDEAHGITAAQAQSLRDGLTSAYGAVSFVKQQSRISKEARDAAFKALRARLSGLCAELRQRIGLYDPRWLAFGLNIPGASTTPAVPENVTAISYGSGQILAACDAVPNASHYRFFTQANLEQLEPVFAGNSYTPSLVISGLEAGQPYQVFVSAANAAGESDLSLPAEVTPIALAAAA